MYRVGLCLAMAIMITALAACGNPSQAGIPASTEIRAAVMNADAAIKETVLVADPQGAVDAVYQELTTEPKLTKVEAGKLEEIMGVPEYDVASFVAYTSEAKSGLCDIAIIEPKEGKMDSVREALMLYRTQRAEQFKNFDILSAYSIASGALVFSQGDYVVMLMLPDNEAAQDILDMYLPPV